MHKTPKLIAWLLVFLCFAQTAFALDPNALPTGFKPITGGLSIGQTNNTLNVNSPLNRSIAEWQTFNIGKDAIVNFNLPSNSSAVLNRVTGGFNSEIFGQLNSNGRVFLVNPSGILFGAGSAVNVNSLFASTLDISNSDFLAGIYTFKQNNSKPASIINYGSIKADSINLFGGSIANHGSLEGSLINLAVGQQITFSAGEGVGVQVKVDQALQEKVENINQAIVNTGSIKAEGGYIKLQADFANALYNLAVNNTGLIEANALSANNGIIELISNNNHLANSGTIQASDLINIKAGTLDNAGYIHSDLDLNMNLLGGRTIERTATDQTIIHSPNGSVDAPFGNRPSTEIISFSLFNRPNASITAGHDLNIVAGTIYNTSAEISAENNLNIWANLLVNERTGFYTEYIPLAWGGNRLDPYVNRFWEKDDYYDKYAYWIDRVGNYNPAYLGAGNELNLFVNHTFNKNSLIEAGQKLYVDGGSFTNEAKVLQATQLHVWRPNGEKQYYEPSVSIGSAYSSVFSGDKADFILSGNFNNQGHVSANGDLKVQAANFVNGIVDPKVQTPPVVELPSFIKLPFWPEVPLDLPKINLTREIPALEKQFALDLSREIRNMLFNLTGTTYFGKDWKSATATLKELELNANEAIKADLSLEYGKALTQTQINKLNKPILWLEADEKGNLHYVIYVPENYRKLSSPEGLLQAQNINLEIKDTAHNTGSIETPSAPLTGGTSGNITITADKIINEQRTASRSKDVRVNDGMFSGHTERVYYEEIQSGGNLSGKNITLKARSEIQNKGGDIAAEETLKLTAPKILNEAQVGSEVITWKSGFADKMLGNKNTYSVKPIFESASLSGKTVEISSGREDKNIGSLKNIGSNIYGDEKVSISGFDTVENSWITGTYTVKDNYSFSFSGSSAALNHEMKTAHVVQGSSIASGGDIDIKANTFKNTASDLVAGNDINIKANNIEITDAIVQSTNTNSSISASVNLPLTASINYQTTDSTNTSHQSSNIIAGNNLNLTPSAPLTGGTSSINIIGSNLIAGNDLELSANNINIQNGLYTDTVNTTGGGVFAGLGVGAVTVGAQAFHSEGSFQSLTPSTLFGNNITINGTNSVNFKASIAEANDKLTINTNNLNISGEYERANSETINGGGNISIAPGGIVGGGVNIGYEYQKSGNYQAAVLGAPNLVLNAPNQTIDGAVINGKEINPHDNYSEGHSFNGGIGFGGGSASLSFGIDDFQFSGSGGRTNSFGIGYQDFALSGGLGHNADGSTSLFGSGSAYGFGITGSRTNNIPGISNDHPVYSLGGSYGPLALSGDFQHGEIKNINGMAGFWGFSHQVNPWDEVCFDPEAPIEIENGKELKAKNIKLGQLINSYNEQTGKFELKRVKNIFHNEAEEMLHIRLSDGRIAKATTEHPFLINNVWVAAKDLKPKDKLFSSKNKNIVVESIELIKAKSKTINFEIEDNHTYIAYGVVVHNDCVFNSKTSSFEWKADGYTPKEGEAKLTEEQTQTLAFISGFSHTLSEDQVNSLLTSTATVFGLTATGEGKEYLASMFSSFSDSFHNFITYEPIDPLDLSFYRYGELTGHGGTILIGAGEIFGGSLLVEGSGALEIGSLGTGSIVGVPGMVAGGAIAGQGAITTNTGFNGLVDTFNQMQGEQGAGGGGSSNGAFYKNNKEAREAATQLGFQETKNYPKSLNSHGELVFQKGNQFISRDNTGHNGGVWKLFDKNGKRIGTLDKNLNFIKK